MRVSVSVSNVTTARYYVQYRTDINKKSGHHNTDAAAIPDGGGGGNGGSILYRQEQ